MISDLSLLNKLNSFILFSNYFYVISLKLEYSCIYILFVFLNQNNIYITDFDL